MTSDPFPVLLCGAGNVNFGTTEGPWNHSKRLEQILGSRLRVVGLVDLNAAAAHKRVEAKLASPARASWRDCQVFTSVEDAAAALTGDRTPLLTLIGLPPYGRGSTVSGKDVDLQVRRHFNKCAIFVEKPISSCNDFSEVHGVAAEMEGSIVSVGYMLRYLKAVQTMKQILEDNELRVMATTATYYMAYEFAGAAGMDRIAFWDNTKDLGPIVGQATHVCDLSRYLGGEVDLSSVAATTVQWDDAPGKLSKQFTDESGILPENRIPRVTSATWKYENGGTGSLVHAVALHEGEYDVEFTVVADGYRLKLIDPYGIPKLHIRRPGQAEDEISRYEDDDPFYTEVAAVIAAAEDTNKRSAIFSDYLDAIKTYEFTWAIRLAGEKSARKS